MDEMNCFVELVNNSAISKESAYTHLKKSNHKIRPVIDKASIKQCRCPVDLPPTCQFVFIRNQFL
jgi:hypothetical protein